MTAYLVGGLIGLGTGLVSIRAVMNPKDATREATGAKDAVADVANATMGLYSAAVEQDSGKLWESAKYFVKAPLHTVDAVVYTTSVIVPFVPIGWPWATLRGHS